MPCSNRVCSLPPATFPRKDGSLQTFANYYETKYGIKVTDLRQPLLVSMPKERDRRGGRNDPVLLVPELVTLTGMDDAMRSNFKLTHSLTKYTLGFVDDGSEDFGKVRKSDICLGLQQQHQGQWQQQQLH